MLFPGVPVPYPTASYLGIQRPWRDGSWLNSAQAQWRAAQQPCLRLLALQLSRRCRFRKSNNKALLAALAPNQPRPRQSPATVLIEGETGTGKELVARAIHFASHRRDKPFIPVNCAGLIESLMESQLFGHKRGAFTGAIADQQGLFEAADGGTLFLDEIGDMPLPVQPHLLRVLQEREITRIGESRPRKINVRVLVATHHYLSKQVAKGQFRMDLLYRIRVATLRIPLLCERLEDIPPLVGAFLGQYRATMGKLVQTIDSKAMRVLMDHTWPGNVRELQSAIEFAMIRCQGETIRLEDLPPDLVSGAVSRSFATDDTVADEKQRLLSALKQTGGNRTAAARLLGIGRSTLYRRMESAGLTQP